MCRLLMTCLIAFTWLLTNAQAASDDGFRIYQDAAPEFIRLEISDVQVAETRGIFGANRTRVSVSGRVIEVWRTASGLVPGALIEIRYDHQARSGSSAETPPILEAGRVVSAFLSRKGMFYVPAARHHSFEEPTEAQMKRYEADRVQSREALLAETERRVRNSPEWSTSPTAPIATLREETDAQPVQTETAPIPSADDQALPVQIAETLTEERPQLSIPSADPVVETTPEPVSTAAPAEIVPTQIEPTSSPTSAQPENPDPLPPAEPITPLSITGESPPLQPTTSPTPADFKPPRTDDSAAREGYSAVYSLIKKGEAAHLEGKRDSAKEAYIQALEKLLKLKTDQPDFQPFMVEYRLKDLKRRISDIEASEKTSR